MGTPGERGALKFVEFWIQFSLAIHFNLIWQKKSNQIKLNWIGLD
jgi:hypothetical protein